MALEISFTNTSTIYSKEKGNLGELNNLIRSRCAELASQPSFTLLAQSEITDWVARRAAKWAGKDEIFPYGSLDALIGKILADKSSGSARQDVGGTLEALAASFIGGRVSSVSWEPDWAKKYIGTTITKKENQDAILQEINGKHVSKIDVWSEGAIGICGGGAKEANEQNFLGKVKDLLAVAASYKKEALVFCSTSTSHTVMEKVASIVGNDNVIRCEGDDETQWQSLATYLQQGKNDSEQKDDK